MQFALCDLVMEFGFCNLGAAIWFLLFGCSNMGSATWVKRFRFCYLGVAIWILLLGCSNLGSVIGWSNLCSAIWVQ